MAAPALRFLPPCVDLSADLRWMLLRAFGPAEHDVRPTDAEHAVGLAETFDVAARIAARHTPARLGAELGDGLAARLAGARRGASALSLLFTSLARELAAQAERAEVPLVFLKFAALELSGALLPGSRGSSDLDVLVPAALAKDFRTTLLRNGFRETGLSGYEHQLAAVAHSSGVLVEIHTCVLGLRIQGMRSADVEALRRADLLDPIPGWPAIAAVPARDALAAHAAVHGLAQHGSVPDSYPALRMLADLADLAADETADRWGSWIARDVVRAELEALLSLRRALIAGALPGGDGEAPHAVLLRHLLAGKLDRAYTDSLRLPGALREVTDRGRASSVLRQGWHALFPSDEELDRVYGAVPSRRARFLRRIRRPIDLAFRALRYGSASLRRPEARILKRPQE